MTDESARGPQVQSHEELLRAIVRPEWWNVVEDRPSSAVFSFPKFSAFIESKTTEDHPTRKLPVGSGQFPDGSGLLRFNSGTARELDFDARHEPEGGDDSHANVYCDLNSNQRKKRIRKFLEAPTTSVVVAPDVERLRASARTA